ncbi:VCBS repeat-containing protein [candidate division WOR-3 bacterium]|nr:VCBS repeat-containing protein [candidate division WOR-3 bacterium]
MLTTKLALLLLLVTGATADTRLKRVALLPRGATGPAPVICADTDHDSLYEIVYYQHNGGGPTTECWDIQEYRPFNRYELVKSDTGIRPYPSRLTTGNFMPYGAGDVDRDGRTDLVGNVTYKIGDSSRLALCTVESADSVSLPETLNWYYPFPGPIGGFGPSRYTDLDRDERREILIPREGAMVFENVADDRESLVYNRPPTSHGLFAVGDFDCNGRTDFAGVIGVWVVVKECVGDNSYATSCSLFVAEPNGADIFAGSDVDGSGRPEFFVNYDVYGADGWTLHLYMFEAESEHLYQPYFIGTEYIGNYDPWPKSSLCADLDGDSIEEVIWACAAHVAILKATGPHQFRRVTWWSNDAGPVTYCNAWDFNGNGYKELVVGGCSKTSFLEVDPIKVWYPNVVRTLVAGDTVGIWWQLFTPPRCDSISLFLKTDTVVQTGERFWRLDTIVTGLAPTESSFAWVVPDTQLAWAKVLAIAYGPGWQFDESDSAFAIVPAGIEELPRVLVRDWTLSVSPNPAGARAMVSYDVPVASEVSLVLFDAAGRVVSELASGPHQPGSYSILLPSYVLSPHSSILSAGVYFLREAGPKDQGFKVLERKIVITR